MVKRYPLEESRLFQLRSKKRLAQLLGIELSTLRQLVKRSDNYRVFQILQSNGKIRIVEEPKPDLKRVHARLADLLARIEPPAYLHSGTKGRSYVTNAKTHVARGRVIKTDLAKFYPMTSHRHVFIGLLRELKCSGDVANLLADLCTFAGHVPTGSPVSMSVAFWAHKQIFDQHYQRLKAQGIELTVYVDDLTMSGKDLNRSHLCAVKKSFKSAGLTCHKTRIFDGNRPKLITGAVVTDLGLRLPNRRHLNIGQGIRQLSGPGTPSEKEAASRRLLGQINEAAAIEDRSKVRLPGLKSLISRLSQQAGHVQTQVSATD